jgi:hypothetical protein
MKKIFTITNVKNESDIIESFCRYNLTYCDGMLIYENNRSTDNTREIIRQLINEGLPIFFADSVYVERYVAAKNAIAKLALDEYGAELIVPLDADEFLSHTDGLNPRQALEAFSEDTEYQIPWRNYVYEKEPDIELGFIPNNFSSYRNPIFEVRNKSFASRLLIQAKQAGFIPGAHAMVYPEEFQDSVTVEVHPKLVLSHFPLRSKVQLMNKVIPNWICKWREPFPARDDQGFQLGRIWNELKENGEISNELIKQHSLEYSVDESALPEIYEKIGNELTVEDPMDFAFCSDKLQLRYTDYREAEKTFMKAVLTEFELSLAALPEREQKTIELLEKTRHENSAITIRNNELKQSIAEIYNSNTWKAGSRIKKVFGLFSAKKTSSR